MTERLALATVSADLRPFGRWAGRVFSRFLPMLAIACAIVWATYQEPIERQIVDALMDGREIAISSGWDARLVQRLYIRGLRRRNDVVVFASSRGFRIHQTLFPGQRFFNNSVAGANTEDVLGIYMVYRQAGLVPGSVILSAEPWMFNDPPLPEVNGYPVLRRAIEREINDGLRRLGRPRLPGPQSSTSMMSPRWLDLGSVRRGINSIIYRQAAPASVARLIQSPDGSLRGEGPPYDSGTIRAKAAEIDANLPPGFIGPLSHINPERERLFEDMVRLMIADGVAVRLLLVPVHPVTWHVFVTHEQYAAVPRIEHDVLAFANTLGVPVYGSYDPAVCGVEETEFRDAWHPTDSGIKRVLLHCLRPR